MINKLFEKHDDQFLKFDMVQNKTSNRADLHAFNLLDKIIPGNTDMISAAEHDEIWLDVDLDELVERATEDQIIDLIRSGVRYDRSVGSLVMFV